MSLFDKWKELAYEEKEQEEYDEFWKIYLEKEKGVYENILENKTQVISGKLNEVAEKYHMEPVDFTGFIDGISTSLTEEIELENLDEESQIELKIDFEKLFFNMLEAKAPWLYELTQWEDILSQERRKEITKEYRRSKIVVNDNKIGRNEPCPCGSGKKYKKCCGISN